MGNSKRHKSAVKPDGDARRTSLAPAPSPEQSLVDRWISVLKNHRLTAPLIFIGIVAGAVIGFWKEIIPGRPPIEETTQRAVLDVLRGRILSDANMDGMLSFEVQLRNTGNTPANIDAKALRLFVLQDERHLPDADGEFRYKDELRAIGTLGNPLMVPAGKSAVLTIDPVLVYKSVLHPYAGDLPLDSDWYVVIFGYLPYHDVFGKQHDVRWGWLVDVREADIIKEPEAGTVDEDDSADFRAVYNVGAFPIRRFIDDDAVEKVLKCVDLSK